MGVYDLNRRRFVERVLSAGAGTAMLPTIALASGASAYSGAAPPQDARLVLCVFSKHLQFLSDYAAMADAAVEAGFDGVDLTVRPGGHVLPENAARDLPLAVEAVRAAGLAVPTITTHITAADQEHARTILETAAELGVPGYRMGWLRYDNATPRVLETLEALKPQMADLAALNEELGIHGDYQNHDGTYVGAPVWDLAVLFEDLDPAWIGVQYDIRHATVEGAHSWPLALDLVAPRVLSLVVKDFRWISTDVGAAIENTPLGSGSVDFSAFWQRVRTYELRRPVSMHFEYDMPADAGNPASVAVRRDTIEAMRRDLTMLRKMFVQAGVG